MAIKSIITLIILTITFVNLIPFSLAESSYESVFNQIGNKVLVDQNITFDSEKEMSLILPNDAHSISANLNYSLEDGLLSIKGKEIRVSYLSNDLLSKSADGYYLVNKIVFNEEFTNVVVKAVLEEGNFAEKDKVFPEPYSIETDGEQIFIIWNLNNIKKGDDFPFFISIRTTKSGFGNWIWIILIAIIIAFGYYLYSKKGIKKMNKPESIAEIDRHLVESEKKVLGELRKADRGELWQKQLQLSTGFSKAKLSRIIRNLESRNLIEKIPFGNTNKVRLK